MLQPLGIRDVGDGLQVVNQDAVMLSHTAISVGDVLSVDTSIITNDKFTTLKTPVAGDISNSGAFTGGIFCVAMTAATVAGQKVQCRFVGVVPALISGTPASGAYVIATTGKQCAAAAAAANNGNRVVGIMLETGVNATLKKVLFNGFGMAQNLTNTT